MSGPKVCFVICPFGDVSSDARKRSDLLLELIIRPVAEEFQYAVDRADLSGQPGIVTIHVIQHLIDDALVIADITDRNPNVFYELAIRHAIRRPYIQVISSGHEIPFNIQEIQTVVYDLHTVAGIKNAGEMVKKQILYYESGGRVTSPVSVAIDEMIGTSSVKQFIEITNKLAELETGIIKTSESSKEVKEIKRLVEELSSKVQSLGSGVPTAKGERPKTKGPDRDGDSSRGTLNEYLEGLVDARTRAPTIREWMQLDQSRKK